jgi:hypothetical protein
MSQTFPGWQEPSRRDLLRAAAGSLGVLAGRTAAAAEPTWQLVRFSAEVTGPVGHSLMGGGIAPAQKIDDPFFAHGLVLQGGKQPVVLVAVDWCEIRNDAYERWRTVLAQAAQTTPAHVLVTSVHQHDAPIAVLEAQRLLDHQKAAGRICDVAFHEQAVQRVAQALRGSKDTPPRHAPGPGPGPRGTGCLEPSLPRAGRPTALRPDQRHARSPGSRPAGGDH